VVEFCMVVVLAQRHYVAIWSRSTMQTSAERNSFRHEGFSRSVSKIPFLRQAARSATRGPATTRRSQAPHVAPSRSS